MQTDQPHLAKTVDYYHPLLQHYARRLVHDGNMAANIVQEVLECQYELNSLVPGRHLRQVLKTDVLNYCFYYIQAKMFDRKLIKVPWHNYIKIKEESNNGKLPFIN